MNAEWCEAKQPIYLDHIHLSSTWGRGNSFSSRVIWNFNKCNTLKLQNVGWEGLVLAPRATVSPCTSGVINGQFFVKNYEIKSGQECSWNGFIQVNKYHNSCPGI